ncbi:extracellular solute-binding protein [Lacrimispora indolis]|uniref:extracellular solute-binding protein n=1 Tax=Lacrimispora indolis TaxID=69825 RepID=UPI000429EDA0|nr:extracellular solute-binding protein [[Clostridium] methoxybenzovorans]
MKTLNQKKTYSQHRCAVFIMAAFLAACFCVGCGRTGPEQNQEETLAASHGPDRETYEDEITIMHIDAGKKEFEAFLDEAEKALNMRIHAVESPINADSRHARISSLLAAGDTSVDVLSVNDEMISEFKHAGYLEPLQDDVMNNQVVSHFPQEYLKEMAMDGDQIYSVPYMMDILMLWVNDAYLKKAGLTDVTTPERLNKFLSMDYGEGCYAYGGAWEKTYVYNEIGEFINLFGGDYYNWNDPKTRAAMEFLKGCVEKGYSPIDQLLDQYEQLEQKFIDGKYGMVFLYSGTMNTFVDSGVHGKDKIHLTPLPDLGGRTTYIATWQYVLNKASLHKEAARKFLAYAASREGSISYAKKMNRMPAREDVIWEENFDIAGYKEMRDYLKTTRMQARFMPKNSIEYVADLGALFQKYIAGEMDLDEFCMKMQEMVDKNRNKGAEGESP